MATGDIFTRKLYIPVTDFAGYAQSAFAVQASGVIGTNMEVGLSHNTDAATFEGGTGITAERNLTTTSPVEGLLSAGAGNPLLIEIGTTGIVGALMDTAGDDVRHFMAIPNDWDLGQQIKVAVMWATEAADTDTATWKFLYTHITPDTTVLIAPATALDTVITADAAIGVAKTIQKSPQGIINADSLTKGNYLSFLAELDAATITVASEGTYLLGVEFEYVPRAHSRTVPGLDPWDSR